MSDTTDEDIRRQIGHRIKVRRVELELRPQELADPLGLQQNHLSEWEKGSRAIRAEQLVRLAKVLGVSVAQLVGEQPRSL
jgi:transcriptional regulator with XRE-family HTH domain